MDEMLTAGRDIKTLIESLTESERRQALALLQGMVIGKELAEQKQPA